MSPSGARAACRFAPEPKVLIPLQKKALQITLKRLLKVWRASLKYTRTNCDEDYTPDAGLFDRNLVYITPRLEERIQTLPSPDFEKKETRQ